MHPRIVPSSYHLASRGICRRANPPPLTPFNRCTLRMSVFSAWRALVLRYRRPPPHFCSYFLATYCFPLFPQRLSFLSPRLEMPKPTHLIVIVTRLRGPVQTRRSLLSAGEHIYPRDRCLPHLWLVRRCDSSAFIQCDKESPGFRCFVLAEAWVPHE